MLTLAEIESAIEKLPTEHMLQVAAWLDDRCAMIQASESVFTGLDTDEGENAGKQLVSE